MPDHPIPERVLRRWSGYVPEESVGDRLEQVARKLDRQSIALASILGALGNLDRVVESLREVTSAVAIEAEKVDAYREAINDLTEHQTAILALVARIETRMKR